MVWLGGSVHLGWAGLILTGLTPCVSPQLVGLLKDGSSKIAQVGATHLLYSLAGLCDLILKVITENNEKELKTPKCFFTLLLAASWLTPYWPNQVT